MARPRLELQSLLEGIMSECAGDNIQRVWFQPPSSVYLTYPCIVYHPSSRSIRYADNSRYMSIDKYTVTVMDLNPESEIPDKIQALPYSSFERRFEVDGLNHTTFSIYF